MFFLYILLKTSIFLLWWNCERNILLDPISLCLGQQRPSPDKLWENAPIAIGLIFFPEIPYTMDNIWAQFQLQNITHFWEKIKSFSIFKFIILWINLIISKNVLLGIKISLNSIPRKIGPTIGSIGHRQKSDWIFQKIFFMPKSRGTP